MAGSFKAGVPSLKEPRGMTRMDWKRPDGLTSIPWREDRSATWDITVTNMVAVSYLPISSSTAAVAAETAAQREETKYSEISKNISLFPLAFGNMDSVNCAGQEFTVDLGHWISAVTKNPRESCFLFQRISVARQFFNAIHFTHPFKQEHDVFHNKPGDTKIFTYTIIINKV
jgi:hypothetical protein